MIGIGATLRQAREEQGFSLKDMHKKTNIQVDYLQALEAEKFDQLPSPFYTRGFLRAYAKSLKLDAAYLLELYEGKTQKTGTDPQKTGLSSPAKTHAKRTLTKSKVETFAPRRDVHKRKRKKQSGRARAWITMALVLVALLVIGLYFSFL